jgi:hypothetical protein
VSKKEPASSTVALAAGGVSAADRGSIPKDEAAKSIAAAIEFVRCRCFIPSPLLEAEAAGDGKHRVRRGEPHQRNEIRLEWV